MLEHDTLLLRPWSLPADGTRQRPIVEPATHGLLGFARTVKPRPGWRGWFDTPALEVHEAEDEPLVFTVRRLGGWKPTWEVRDADGHLVGLRDRIGRPFALRGKTPDGTATGFFRSPDEHELARLVSSTEGTRLEFAANGTDNPFLRMLLLAAALV